MCSWYGPNFHGKMTANGEIFNTNDYTCAHRSIAFNSILKVTNLDNGKIVYVRVTDRGPFAKDRIIDLSQAAANKIDMIKKGTAHVKIELIEEGDGKYYRPNGKTYDIQIAALSDKKKCADLQEKLLKNGVKTVIEKTNNGLLRVCVKNVSYTQMQHARIRVHNLGIHKIIIKQN